MECCLHIHADGTVCAVDTGVTLPKYTGEPRRRREEHERDVPYPHAGTKLGICHYPCVIL